MPMKHSEEFKDKVARLVLAHRDDFDSQRAAIRKTAERLGVSAESLRRWVRQS